MEPREEIFLSSRIKSPILNSSLEEEMERPVGPDPLAEMVAMEVAPGLVAIGERIGAGTVETVSRVASVEVAGASGSPRRNSRHPPVPLTMRAVAAARAARPVAAAMVEPVAQD
jgi:hypothetical protein